MQSVKTAKGDTAPLAGISLPIITRNIVVVGEGGRNIKVKLLGKKIRTSSAILKIIIHRVESNCEFLL